MLYLALKRYLFLRCLVSFNCSSNYISVFERLLSAQCPPQVYQGYTIPIYAITVVSNILYIIITVGIRDIIKKIFDACNYTWQWTKFYFIVPYLEQVGVTFAGVVSTSVQLKLFGLLLRKRKRIRKLMGQGVKIKRTGGLCTNHANCSIRYL